jgi:hypothetical protein
MSFQFNWPENGWPSEIEEKVRSSLESSIRKAMNAGANNNNSNNNTQKEDQTDDDDDDIDQEQHHQQPLSTLIRGSVTVDGLSLGTKAPTIVLKRITELTPANTSVQVHVEYRGNAWISLKGIEINLDPTRNVVGGTGGGFFGGGGGGNGSGGSGGGGRKAEVVAPFFCPLTLKLTNLHLCGDFKVEISHEIFVAGETKSVPIPDSFTEMMILLMMNGNNSQEQQIPSPVMKRKIFLQLVATSSNHHFFGEQQEQDDATITTERRNSKEDESKFGGTTTKKKTITTTSPRNEENNNSNNKSQTRGENQQDSQQNAAEFIRDFSVESNFVPVPQAVEKIKGTIRAAIKPLFQKLRSQGMTIQI